VPSIRLLKNQRKMVPDTKLSNYWARGYITARLHNSIYFDIL